MKVAAKHNFAHHSGVFVLAAAILVVAGFISELPTYFGSAPTTEQVQSLMTRTSKVLSQGASASAHDINAVSNAWLNIYGGQKNAQTSLYVLLFTLLLLLGVTVLQVGMSHISLLANAGGAPKFKDFFTPLQRFGRWLGLELWMYLRIYLWTLLFIIPGLIAAYRYRQAVYLMLEDPDLGINKALRLSGELMRGYKWRLFVLDLSFLFWLILESFISVLFVINVLGLYLIPYMELTMVEFYRDLRRERPVEGLLPVMVAVEAPPAPQPPAA